MLDGWASRILSPWQEQSALPPSWEQIVTDAVHLSGPTTDPAAAADPPGEAGVAPGPGDITPGDARYPSMVRAMNHRFVGRPDYVRVVTTTEQVTDAVNEAVTAGKQIAVRSGGHCFENFTASPDVKVLLDMSEMTNVYFDAERRAFAVEAGATLGHVYRVLFKYWNVTVPAGECPEVGVGGHFAGGGYGPLTRRYGSVVDYLHAVEVVVVDATGTATAVVATRDPGDPHRDLWWAHTGAGGGNFGVVTRYWLRTPGATSPDPAELLPKAPAMARIGHVMWPWSSLNEEAFARIVRNFSNWFERNDAADSPTTNLYGFLQGLGRTGFVGIGASIDDGVPGAGEMMTAFYDAVAEGVGIAPIVVPQQVQPWLFTMTFPGHGYPGDELTSRVKIKSAYLRKGYSDRQIAVIHRYLTTQDMFPVLVLIGYGGQLNAVDPHMTATVQRDSIHKAIFISTWQSEDQDEANLARIREFYRDLYAETGGVPVPGEISDGAYINYPDTDLADPAWNTSGVPWHTLYYKENYPHLQEIKKRYDPRNVFRHALSIEIPH
jgi:FAD/FMN-containing dehydrogenase